ncbi:MAG TPA: hypothetical protein VGK96_25110, partial [Candidatus Sulfotelmatobacter sp.]
MVSSASTIRLQIETAKAPEIVIFSTSGDIGQQNTNQYWTNSNNQGNTAYMLWQIASHYKGNPTIAGYDLIN